MRDSLWRKQSSCAPVYSSQNKIVFWALPGNACESFCIFSFFLICLLFVCVHTYVLWLWLWTRQHFVTVPLLRFATITPPRVVLSVARANTEIPLIWTLWRNTWFDECACVCVCVWEPKKSECVCNLLDNLMVWVSMVGMGIENWFR